jgi:hypothetical protein
MITTSHALAGRIQDARAMLETYLRRAPGSRISSLLEATIFRRPEDTKKIKEGYRIAGMPE